LALTTLTTLAYQLLLVRIFSMTLWYHYTFVAISVAMFGLTLGALLVHLCPGWFAVSHAGRQMGLAASCFAVLIVVSLRVHAHDHVTLAFDLGDSPGQLAEVAAYYLLLALPFAASGVCVTIALTRFPQQTGKLYAADLAAAGLGCLLVAGLSRWIDAPSLVLDVAALAAVGALVCHFDLREGDSPIFGASRGDDGRKLGQSPACPGVFEQQEGATAGSSSSAEPPRNPALLDKPAVATVPLSAWDSIVRIAAIVASAAVALAIVALVVFQYTPAGRRAGLFHLTWIKGKTEEPPLYERWNAHSRVAIWEAGRQPLGWGLSSRWQPHEPIRQLWLNIDAAAGTVLTEFHGDLAPLEYLRYDVTNAAHYLRPHSRVLVIGAGGGRDILSALYFHQPKIVGVELNGAILAAVNGPFGELTGHLDRRPDVTLVHDEARSFLAAQPQRSFDIIQASLIDTWAANAAGAYALSENALYTTQAWDCMLTRLTDRGVITFSRWYADGGPSHIYRLTALAVAALRHRGVASPRDHLLILYRPHEAKDPGPTGIATLLVSRAPFSAADMAAARRLAGDMAFQILLSPEVAVDKTLAQLASGEDFENFTSTFPIDIRPPTDDRPFFFDMLRLGDVLTFRQPKDPLLTPNMSAITTLGMLLVVVLTLTVLCVLVPLAAAVRRRPPWGTLPFFLYFGSIGLGFMLVEIAMMQRLSIYLGHPIYGMTVVLFCLLLASGAGSWLSSVLVKDAARGAAAPCCLAALVLVVLTVGLATPPLLEHMDGMATPARIALAAGLLGPLGLAMGMGFPLGMRAAFAQGTTWTACWLGINGATSVCGSVLAVILALSFGIRAVLLIGVGCYLLAWLALSCAPGRFAR
jgi:hypothetical protein